MLNDGIYKSVLCILVFTVSSHAYRARRCTRLVPITSVSGVGDDKNPAQHAAFAPEADRLLDVGPVTLQDVVDGTLRSMLHSALYGRAVSFQPLVLDDAVNDVINSMQHDVIFRRAASDAASSLHAGGSNNAFSGGLRDTFPLKIETSSAADDAQDMMALYNDYLRRSAEIEAEYEEVRYRK